MTSSNRTLKSTFYSVLTCAVPLPPSDRRSSDPGRVLDSARIINACTLCLKNVPPLTCYNLYIHNSITTIFGKNIAEKVGNQNILYFPTSPN